MKKIYVLILFLSLLINYLSAEAELVPRGIKEMNDLCTEKLDTNHNEYQYMYCVKTVFGDPHYYRAGWTEAVEAEVDGIFRVFSGPEVVNATREEERDIEYYLINRAWELGSLLNGLSINDKPMTQKRVNYLKYSNGPF